MNRIQRFVLESLNVREWIVGPGSVSASDEAFGKDADEWAPGEYGNYIATSNHVYAMVTHRAELLAMLPLMAYTVDGQGDRTEDTTSPLAQILDTPNPFYDGTWLREITQMDLDLWGRWFWFLEGVSSDTSPPREMYRAKPTLVSVVPSATEYIAGYLLTPEDGGEPIPFAPHEVIYGRYPNPLDELAGLSPIAAARLAADTGTAALKHNKRIFDQGTMAAGIVSPPEGDTWTVEQVKELERDFNRRLKGVDKAHRWGFFRQRVDAQQLGWSPKDAEHLETMRYSLEEVARAYRYPLDLLRGEVTFENQDASMRRLYTMGIIPAAWRMERTLQRHLAPRYGTNRLIAHDTSGIEALQENRAELVQQITMLADKGVPLNKLLSEFMPHLLPEGGDGYAWGDVAWLQASMVPISGPEIVVAPPGTVAVGDVAEPGSPADVEQDEDAIEAGPQDDGGGRETAPMRHRSEFDDAEHREHWERLTKSTDPLEREFAELVRGLFRQQQASVLDKLSNRALTLSETGATSLRLLPAELDDVWDMARWIALFRSKARPSIRKIVKVAAKDLGFPLPSSPAANFIEKRTQRFAKEVNGTTWRLLRASLSDGIDGGESVPELSKRVEAVMGTRIQSSAETIARTEVMGAYNGGGLIAAEEAGAKYKKWMTARDSRVRPGDDLSAKQKARSANHRKLHGVVKSFGEDFQGVYGHGPGPGQMGDGREDINCRCSLRYARDPDLF